ncbi:hypothetical protein V6N13_091744 [Hibiscus sabdariffa]|uniref:Uncharacterized protein n=1 Tax=Hibiscus sabdariffa TaxID=183260 RepID=A0ABR2QEU9_9ROSI
MEESLKELADHAAKAVQEKIHISAKEFIKLTITRNLDRNATRFKEVKAKAAEEEEKNVEAEWGRMKDLMSYIKGMI